MLVQNHEPLERHCRAVWSLVVASAAIFVIVAASGLRVSAEVPPGAESPAKKVEVAKDVAKPSRCQG